MTHHSFRKISHFGISRIFPGFEDFHVTVFAPPAAHRDRGGNLRIPPPPPDVVDFYELFTPKFIKPNSLTRISFPSLPPTPSLVHAARRTSLRDLDLRFW